MTLSVTCQVYYISFVSVECDQSHATDFLLGGKQTRNSVREGAEGQKSARTDNKMAAERYRLHSDLQQNSPTFRQVLFENLNKRI